MELDQALLRAFQWMHTPDPDGPGYPPEPMGDDAWLSYLVNYYYAGSEADFPQVARAAAGKNMGWTDWTHACPDLVTDDDLDGIPDSCDNCLGMANPDQADVDADGVGDLCDNCTLVYNRRIDPKPFQTTTGGQLDDDADGYGNACDADLNNSDALVNSQDLALFKLSTGKKRHKSVCGAGGAEACDV